MVPRPRIELGTRGFSVRQEHLFTEILTHLVAVGQAAEQFLLSIQQDNGQPTENLARFGSLTSHFWGLDKVPLPGQVEEAKSEGDKP